MRVERIGRNETMRPATIANSAMNSRRPAHICSMATIFSTSGIDGEVSPTSKPVLHRKPSDSHTESTASLPCAMNSIAPSAAKTMKKMAAVMAEVAAAGVRRLEPKCS